MKTSIVEFVLSHVLGQLSAPASVLLVGSHAEGNATAASDIDLIAIRRESSERTRLRRQEFEVGDKVVGVTYLDAQALRRRLGTLDSIYRKGAHSRVSAAPWSCDP